MSEPVRCLNLRHKSMYYSSPPTTEQELDKWEDGGCWCVLTQRSIGPDGQGVGPRPCRNADRKCFLGLDRV